MIWPFAVRKSNGYAAHSVGRKNIDAHRYVCTLANGEPEVGLQAAHRCGNKLCVNPAHLYWGDALSNMADAKAHGTMLGGGRYRQRLFDKDIQDILASKESLISLGAHYGMDPSYIGKVRRQHMARGLNG